MSSKPRGSKKGRKVDVEPHGGPKLRSIGSDCDASDVDQSSSPDTTMNIISQTHSQPDHAVGGASLGQEANARLGRQLRELYEQVAHDPVPQRFIEILAQLENQKKQS